VWHFWRCEQDIKCCGKNIWWVVCTTVPVESNRWRCRLHRIDGRVRKLPTKYRSDRLSWFRSTDVDDWWPGSREDWTAVRHPQRHDRVGSGVISCCGKILSKFPVESTRRRRWSRLTDDRNWLYEQRRFNCFCRSRDVDIWRPESREDAEQWWNRRTGTVTSVQVGLLVVDWGLLF
jgi:hypothetical protein